MKKMRPLLLGILVTSALLAGCSDDPMTALSGIYQIDSWTDNATSCAAEGPSVLANEPDKFFFVRVESLFGQEFVTAPKCPDLATCRVDARDETIMLTNWTFADGSDEAGWTSTTVFASTTGTGNCTGSVTIHTLTTPATDQVAIDSRDRDAPQFPVDGDGSCSTEAAEAAAEGQPCVALEVVTATRVERF